MAAMAWEDGVAKALTTIESQGMDLNISVDEVLTMLLRLIGENISLTWLASTSFVVRAQQLTYLADFT